MLIFYFFRIAFSFVEIVEYIFTAIPGKIVFLSGHLCQDPLEKFFGCVRQKGHSSDNPTVQEFCKTTQTLRVANSVCASVHIKNGNCRGHKRHREVLTEEIKEAKPLDKRRRKR